MPDPGPHLAGVTGARAVARGGLVLALLWWVGVNLRTVLLGVPPALPALHGALALSYGEAGLLTSLPVLVMALGAVPGAFLTARFGARRAVAAGLGAVALGTALRGSLPSAATLFAFTFLLALGIAVTQPAIPSVVQAWFPGQVARAIAIYSNGLLVGEVLAATLTLPLLLGVLHLGWQGALAAWALPAGLALAAWWLWAPRREAVTGPSAGWWPRWRSARTWRLGLLLGGASVAYFGMNTWIPDTLSARNAAGSITVALGSLNFMQLPVSGWIALAGDRMLGRRWPYVMAGLAIAGGVAGYSLGPTALVAVWAGLVGAAASLVFILNLGLPALMAPGDVARVSGFMLMVGYACAFVGPALGGVAWDRTGQSVAALLPIAVSGLLVVVLGATLPRVSPVGGSGREVSPPAW